MTPFNIYCTDIISNLLAQIEQQCILAFTLIPLKKAVVQN